MRPVWPLISILLVVGAAALTGCDAPQTQVVFDNGYPASALVPFVVYRARWHAVSSQDPLLPGASSDPQDTVAASPNTAYVVLAPGWDPVSGIPPTSFIVLQSMNGFEVHLDQTLHIPVDDATFVGDCAAGSFLSQDQADFITQRIFASDFLSLRYDAATCTTTGGS
jgi:hypothetical protein